MIQWLSSMIKNQKLLLQGYTTEDFPISPIVLEWLQKEKWAELDQYFLEISKEDGLLRKFLSHYLDFHVLEHIIAIRRSNQDGEIDEDGIWHDDGSRFLGFSLSLNLNPASILGGELRFKRKDSDQLQIFAPQPYGKIVLFLSGIYGYEHMVSAVTKGERIVIAGWCS
jgi:hypothetical protein